MRSSLSTLFFVLSVFFCVSCNPNPTNSESSQPVGGGTGSNTHLTSAPTPTVVGSSLSYDFEDGLLAPLRHVGDTATSFLQEPELSSSGLNLIPDGLVEIDSTQFIDLSRLHVEPISTSGGLVNLIVNGYTNLSPDENWNYYFEMDHTFRSDENGSHFGGGIGSSTHVGEGELFTFNNTFFSGFEAISSEFDLGIEVRGAIDDAQINQFEITNIEVRNAPLTDADLTMGPLEANYFDIEGSCGLNEEDLTSTMTMSSIDGNISAEGEVYEQGLLIATWSLSSSNFDPLYLEGHFESTHPDWPGSYAISEYFVYTWDLAIRTSFASCSAYIQYPIGLENIPTDENWVSVFNVDLTSVTDLAAEGIVYANRQSEPVPQVVNSLFSKELELLPQGVSLKEGWASYGSVHTPVVEFHEETQAVRIRVDYEATTFDTDLCDHVLLKVGLENESSDWRQNYIWDSVSLEDTTRHVVEGQLSSIIFVPESLEKSHLNVQLSTTNCEAGETLPDASLLIDNLEMEQLGFDVHPLAGPWELEFKTYGQSQCTETAEKTINLPVELGAFYTRLSSGYTVEGELLPTGELTAIVSSESQSFSFEGKFEQLNSLWTGSFGGLDCNASLFLSRSDQNQIRSSLKRGSWNEKSEIAKTRRINF